MFCLFICRVAALPVTKQRTPTLANHRSKKPWLPFFCGSWKHGVSVESIHICTHVFCGKRPYSFRILRFQEACKTQGKQLVLDKNDGRISRSQEARTTKSRSWQVSFGSADMSWSSCPVCPIHKTCAVTNHFPLELKKQLGLPVARLEELGFEGIHSSGAENHHEWSTSAGRSGP